jgi:hypothetical protein
MILVYG